MKQRPESILRFITITDTPECRVTICTLGASIQSFIVTDKAGKERDIVLGYDTPEQFENNRDFLGSTIGPFANRIGGGSFTIDGIDYALSCNDGPNTLHSGDAGLHTRLFSITSQSENSVTLYTCLPHLETGFPGNIEIELCFTLIKKSLHIQYSARSDRSTHISLTNHTYFNLNGHQNGSIMNHQVCLKSPSICEVNSSSIPTGRLLPVSGTFYDLNTPVILEDQSLRYPGFDYDHNYTLPGSFGTYGWGSSPASSLTLIFETDAPGVQFYTGKNITPVRGKEGAHYTKYSGLCFEAQMWPDTPNRNNFPSSLVTPENPFTQHTVYTIKDSE
jgi:aldose 1-epimerase